MPKTGDVPTCPKLPDASDAKVERREYQIELVTPMFGGGVEAGQPDESFPIRGTSIRGQLRFWWRMAIGQGLGERMWQREEEIFGSTEFPSPLNVDIASQPQAELIDPTYGDRFGPIAYALFPAIENNRQVVKEGISFSMKLSWVMEDELNRRRKAQNKQRRKDRKPLLPDTIAPIDDEIQIALRAWIALGGIGGRTRRGCGAVHCNDPALLEAELPKIPKARFFVGAHCINALEAWKEAVSAYRDFRQSPRGNKHKKTIRTRNGPKTINVPGRSHWPEADSIRHITGCSLKPQQGQATGNVPPDEDPHDHSTPVVPKSTLPSFPKAALGLPINFHFADGPGKNRPGLVHKDPQDVQLYPLLFNHKGEYEKAERMVSPVITRPLWINGKCCPAVIILPHALPDGVRIEGKKAMANGQDVCLDLKSEKVVGSALAVLRPLKGKTSAIEALVAFLSNGGFKEQEVSR